MRQMLSAFWPAHRQPGGRLRLAGQTKPAAEQIDYAHEALCARFGFAGGAEKHVGCKPDHVELRRNHERLLAASLGSF